MCKEKIITVDNPFPLTDNSNKNICFVVNPVCILIKGAGVKWVL